MDGSASTSHKNSTEARAWLNSFVWMVGHSVLAHIGAAPRLALVMCHGIMHAQALVGQSRQTVRGGSGQPCPGSFTVMPAVRPGNVHRIACWEPGLACTQTRDSMSLNRSESSPGISAFRCDRARAAMETGLYPSACNCLFKLETICLGGHISIRY